MRTSTFPSRLTSKRSGGSFEKLDGVEAVLDEDGKRAYGLDNARSGELVALAAPDAWFTYYYWLDDARAPDFARTVEIHRKPGYDPVELFLDPSIKYPKAAIGWRLLKKLLGFRTLMDVIPLDATLVKGSHGRADTPPQHSPVFLSSEPKLVPEGAIDAPASQRSRAGARVRRCDLSAETYQSGSQPRACDPRR